MRTDCVIPVYPNDITFDLPQGRFLFRVVGVAIHDGHALLHRAVSDDFWSLPEHIQHVVTRDDDVM